MPDTKPRCVVWRADWFGIDRVFVRTPYDQDFVAELKTTVPAAYRTWNDKTKTPPLVWHFDPAYLEPMFLLCQKYFEVTVLDTAKPENIKAIEKLATPVADIGTLEAELHVTALGRRKIDL
jgi:hypothetical protein